MKKSFLAFALPTCICMLLVLISCTKNSVSEIDPTIGLIKQAEGYAIGASTKVVMYTKQSTISTGYTKFYVALYDSISGARIEDAHVELNPLMNMGMMKHSAPYEDPASAVAVDHLFPCSVVFIMSSTAGSWSIDLNVHNHHTNKEGSLTIPITVTDPLKPTIHSFTSKIDGAKYFVALIDPTAPKVGINDMELAIYKKVSMMSFPADSSLSVILNPEMPTMGHGSPNNINPTHVSNGHYKGKVNFTMTGLWKLNLDYMVGNSVADSTQYYEVQF